MPFHYMSRISSPSLSMSHQLQVMLSHIRIIIVCILLFATTIFLHNFSKGTEVPIKQSLDNFSGTIGNWTCTSNSQLSPATIKMLGVDDYISRDYQAPNGRIINLYVSYFACMEGKGFHSPRNCMPGSGWDIASLKPLTLYIRHSEGTPVVINQMIMQKGAKQQIVLYWYHCRGRIIHSEYMEKIYQVIDSIFKRRTDGSFIRIMAPSDKGDKTLRLNNMKEFTRHVIPLLEEYLPGK